MKRPFLPFSKCMDLADYPSLEPELALLDQHGAVEGQHPARRWEYALAHHALAAWLADWPDLEQCWDDHPLRACDVGGAGSAFAGTLRDVVAAVDVIDPALILKGTVNHITFYPVDLWQYSVTQPHAQYDVLTLISVLEHVPDDAVNRLLRAAKILLRPGGLLFLTVDCWNSAGPDTAHFYWMRQRIYTPDRVRALQQTLREQQGFVSFGRGDWTYHGPTVYDYTFASLAMTRKG